MAGRLSDNHHRLRLSLGGLEGKGPVADIGTAFVPPQTLVAWPCFGRERALAQPFGPHHPPSGSPRSAASPAGPSDGPPPGVIGEAGDDVLSPDYRDVRSLSRLTSS